MCDVKEEPKLKISRIHIKQVCKIGQGNECCRYVTVGGNGFECVKHTSLKNYLDNRVKEKSMVAQGDNCEGLTGAEVFRT